MSQGCLARKNEDGQSQSKHRDGLCHSALAVYCMSVQILPVAKGSGARGLGGSGARGLGGSGARGLGGSGAQGLGGSGDRGLGCLKAC